MPNDKFFKNIICFIVVMIVLMLIDAVFNLRTQHIDNLLLAFFGTWNMHVTTHQERNDTDPDN